MAALQFIHSYCPDILFKFKDSVWACSHVVMAAVYSQKLPRFFVSRKLTSGDPLYSMQVYWLKGAEEACTFMVIYCTQEAYGTLWYCHRWTLKRMSDMIWTFWNRGFVLCKMQVSLSCYNFPSNILITNGLSGWQKTQAGLTAPDTLRPYSTLQHLSAMQCCPVQC